MTAARAARDYEDDLDRQDGKILKAKISGFCSGLRAAEKIARDMVDELIAAYPGGVANKPSAQGASLVGVALRIADRIKAASLPAPHDS